MFPLQILSVLTRLHNVCSDVIDAGYKPLQQVKETVPEVITVIKDMTSHFL